MNAHHVHTGSFNFHTLNLQDLLEAREAYHIHLSNLPNVVGTAVGRFRFRVADPGAKEAAAAQGLDREYVDRGPRTLERSAVKPWSWPAILVFVRTWETPSAFARRPDAVVPRALYLPDGRVVPTCVILAPPVTVAAPGPGLFDFPDDFIGGGYPVFSERQGMMRAGSIACLVTDGGSVYALTNRHVAGEPGTEIYSLLRGERVRIGVTHARQLDKAPFTAVYPTWAGTRTMVNLDAALVRVDNVNHWTAQIFGVGEIGATVDMSTNNLSLDFVNTPLRAFGCASGELAGEVQALFYRYTARGGLDYVADLLIGSRPGSPPLATQPGDSGTLWVMDPDKPACPVGVQWGGGRTVAEDGNTSTFALATFLSTICRELSVEVITDWNAAQPQYWGQIGHYKLGAVACSLASNTKLAKLLKANLDRIGIPDANLTRANMSDLKPDRFVPLADVPDDVWKKAGHSRPKDKPSHYADMDQPGAGEFAGKTLLDVCRRESGLSLDTWRRFYESLDVKEQHRGILPFRVWQIFNEMVRYVKAGDVTKFICAAGILAHYIGDAAQPLHASSLHDGDPSVPGDAGVHSAFETAMLNASIPELIDGLKNGLGTRKARPKKVAGGRRAAWECLKLIRRTRSRLAPMDVIVAYRNAPSRTRSKSLWSAIGARTVQCMADGAITLAMLWESAWKEGDGDRIAATKLKAVSQSALMKLYDTQAHQDEKEFLPSYYLKDFISNNVLA